MARLQGRLGAGDRTQVGEYLDSVREVERRIQTGRAAGRGIADARAGASEQHPRRVGRPRQADVRPAGAGAAGRRHARHHLPAGARREHDGRIRRSACPSRTIRCRITRTIRRSSRSWRRSTRTTCRSSPTCSRSCSRRPTATGRCSTTRRTCSAAAWGTRTSTITGTCRSSWPGGGIGGSQGGCHLRYPEATPLANLHLTLLDSVGVHLDSFVDSTGRPGLIAEPLSL